MKAPFLFKIILISSGSYFWNFTYKCDFSGNLRHIYIAFTIFAHFI